MEYTSFNPDIPSIDVSKVEKLEIVIRDDGAVVWINTENGCIFRACQIKRFRLEDQRSKPVQKQQDGDFHR